MKNGLEVDMRDEESEKMCPSVFATREASENAHVLDKKDRTVTIWSDPKRHNDVVNLEDFTILKLLGKGNFGKVVLAMKNKTEKLFAMKILSKKSIIEQNQLEHTKSEHLILQHVNHPFLVSLNSAFQSKHKLYFVMELMRGGELYCLLGKARSFTEEQTKFFVACVILGLGHLHANNFVYRDLKLENVLLDDKGFAK